MVQTHIVMDSGPIISLALNGLLKFMDPLKEKLGGNLIITPSVKYEIIDRPLEIKRFAFEALRVLRYVRKGTLTLVDSKDIEEETKTLLDLANTTFKAKGQWIKIVHKAEIEAIAYALKNGIDTVVIDERTTRMLIENPEGLEVRLSKKLHTQLTINKQNLEEFRKRTKQMTVLRSVEFVMAAYELGLMNDYIPEQLPSGTAEDVLLNSILWGLRLNGCSISDDEITRLRRIVKKPSKPL